MWLIALAVTMVVLVWYSGDNEDLDADGVTWKIYHHSHNCHSIIIVIIIVLTHTALIKHDALCASLFILISLILTSYVHHPQEASSLVCWAATLSKHEVLLHICTGYWNGWAGQPMEKVRRSAPGYGTHELSQFIRAHDDPWRAYLLTSEWMVILWLHCLWLHSVERESWDF